MRLFVAVNLPAAEKARLAQTIDTLAGVSADIRFTAAESLHFTLKFLGEVSASRIVELSAALNQATRRVSPFTIEVGGFGAFPDAKRPRIFWLGVRDPQPLVELQQHIESSLATLGFEPETRAFQPHLTLGRLRDQRARLDGTVMDHLTAAAGYKGVIPVNSADLMRSHPGPRGARYELITASELKMGA